MTNRPGKAGHTLFVVHELSCWVADAIGQIVIRSAKGHSGEIAPNRAREKYNQTIIVWGPRPDRFHT